MEYVLTKPDYEDIRILTAVSESIWESYQALASLEITGKKETSEYQRVMEELRSTMGMEPTLYGRLGNSFPKLSSIISYLRPMQNRDSKKDRLETILEGQNSNMVIERISKKIDSSLSIKDEMKQDIKSMIGELELDENDEMVEQLSKSLEDGANFMNGYMAVAESMEVDKYACFLSGLKKMIESPFYRDVREELIMIKYRMAFVCGKIEEMMLRQNFEVLPQVYLQTNCIGQMEKQGEFTTTMVLVKSSVQTIRKQTDMLLSDYDNTVLSNKDKKVEALVRVCMLRAGLMLLPGECVSSENERFHDTIDSSEYIQEHPQNSEIEEMIMRAYRQYKNDRSIPIQVSFVK